jgi:hypothetical protein
MVDWMIETARAIGTADINAVVFASAAAALTTDAAERARAVLAELDQTLGIRESPYYARHLPAMLRVALAAWDPALATRLADGLEPRYPLEEHSLCAARAQLAEHAGNDAEAAHLYAEAAARWKEFGNVPERAYALFGEGRCLLARGATEAAPPLLEAHDLFSSMGYKPAAAETEALLEQTAATSAS